MMTEIKQGGGSVPSVLLRCGGRIAMGRGWWDPALTGYGQAAELVQWLGAHTALAEDLDPVPSTTSCGAQLRTLGFCRHLHSCLTRHTQVHKCLHE